MRQIREFRSNFENISHDCRAIVINVDKRICKVCNNGVEDEIHFLLKCPILDNVRKATLSVIYRIHPNIERLKDKEKFI